MTTCWPSSIEQIPVFGFMQPPRVNGQIFESRAAQDVGEMSAVRIPNTSAIRKPAIPLIL